MTATTIETSRMPADAQGSHARTRPWLTFAVLAGPLFLGASLTQALTRKGFHLTKEPVSALSLGRLGWLQDLNFALVGLLSLAGAVGIHLAISSGVGRIWLPRLICVVGIGLTAASLFHPDPSGGFPPGTPSGASATSDWHGIMHMVCGSAAFLALIAACFVFGRRFSRVGERRWALGARASAVLFAVALTMSGGHDGPVVLFVGVSIGWLCVATCIAHSTRLPARPSVNLPIT
jgi:hypothetical protein